MLKAYAAAPNTEQIAGETANELAGLIQLVIAKIPLWIAAFIVMALSVVVAKVIRGIVENKLADKIDEDHQEVQILGGRITYVVFLTIGITVGLKIAGIDLTSIIAAVAFGIGFALKDMIMNFLAGIMILVGQQFTIGDFINVGGTMGKVEEIQSRVTILQAIDGTKVIVPNADLFKKQVTSYTSNPFRRIEILVGVDYRSDLENVIKVAMHTLKTTKGVLVEPKPAVLVAEFADSSINLKVRAWVESRGAWLKIKSNLVINLKKEFDKYGITIPWPIKTVVYDKDQDYIQKMIEDDKEEMQAPVQLAAEAALASGQSSIPEQPLSPLGEQR